MWKELNKNETPTIKPQISATYITFPPKECGITMEEYRNITLDLPHLSLDPNTTYEAVNDSRHFDIIKGNNVKPFDSSSFQELVKKYHDPSGDEKSDIGRCEYSLLNYQRLLKNDSWMCDETVSLLTKWIECVKDDNSEKRIVLVQSTSATVLVSHYKRFVEFWDGNIEKANKEDFTETLDHIRRTLKFERNDISNSDCIFITSNVGELHWNLVCVCNLRTINKDFIDFEKPIDEKDTSKYMNEEEFSNYAPPCIIVLDSMASSDGKLPNDTESLAETFRFWLTHDQKINPNGYKFSSNNLPVTMIESIQQTDTSSCGYFDIRNIIGLLLSSENIFPIRIKDLVKRNINKQKYREIIHSIFPKNKIKKMKSISYKKSMQYTEDSVQNVFREEVRALIDRLRKLHIYMTSHVLHEKLKLKNDIQSIKKIKSLINGSDIKIKESINKDNVQMNSEKDEYATRLKELHEFFTYNKKSVKNVKGISCFCPAPKNANFPVTDPHNLPDLTFICSRTLKAGTGFDFDISTQGMLETDDEKEDFIVQYLQRIANGCSITHTPTSPSTGDCGFHLLSYIVAKSPILFQYQNKIRSIFQLDPLIPAKGSQNDNGTEDEYDLSFLLRSLFSQFSANDETTLQDFTTRTSFQNELKDIFDEHNKPKWKDIRKIDSEHGRWNLKKRLRKMKRKNEMWKMKDDWFDFLDSTLISETYNKIVIGYLLKFCKDLPVNQLNTFHSCCEKYIAMPPAVVGSHACFWADSYIISWFELLYQVKCFICIPGEQEEFGFFMPNGNALILDFESYSNNHHFFETKEGSLGAYGLVVLVYNKGHYDRILTKAGNDVALFKVGEELPDLFYKACKIDKLFWKSLSPSKTHRENLKEVERQHKLFVNSKTEYSIGLEVMTQLTKPKFKLSDLQTILFGDDIPQSFKPSSIAQRRVVDEARRAKRYFSDFRGSVSTANYYVLPSFLAVRIFQSSFDNKHELSNVIPKYIQSKHCLHGIHLQLASVMSIFSYNIKQIFGDSYDNYDSLKKAVEDGQKIILQSDPEFSDPIEVTKVTPAKKRQGEFKDNNNNSKSLKLLQTESPDLNKNIKQEKRKLEDSAIANEMSKKNKTSSNETKPFAVTQTQEQNLNEKDDPDAFSTLSNHNDEKNKIGDKEVKKKLSTKINENKSKESKDPKSTIGTKLDNNPILPSNDLKNKLELEKEGNNELTDSDESKTEELNLKEQSQTKPKDLNPSKKDNLPSSAAVKKDTTKHPVRGKILQNSKLSKKQSPPKRKGEFSEYIDINDNVTPQLNYLMASIPELRRGQMELQLNEEDINMCKWEEEEMYQSRFLMSILFHNFNKNKKGKKNKEIYVGTDNVDIWEMDDYYRTSMEESKLKTLGSFFMKKEKIVHDSLTFLKLSNKRGNHAHLIPRFSWTESDTQYCLMHSVIDSPYYNDIKHYFDSKTIQRTIEELMDVFDGITTEDKCGLTGRRKMPMFCCHIGIVESYILKKREMNWPDRSEEFFDINNKINFPLNTFNSALFEVIGNDIISAKKQRESVKHQSKAAKEKKIRKMNRGGVTEDEEYKLNVMDYNHQFEILFKHFSFQCINICMQIAVDVLRKSAIFLLFVNLYGDPLRYIFEQRFIHRQNLFLFNNCFHSIKVYTSKSEIHNAPLYNRNDMVTVYMLFADESRFRVRLTNTSGISTPVIMKPYDVIVVTDKYPIDVFSLSDSTTNYVLLSFSISEEFYNFISKEGNSVLIDRYQEFHSLFGLCSTTTFEKDPHERLVTTVLDRITMKKATTPKTNNNFLFHTRVMSLTIDLKTLYWETMIYNTNNKDKIKQVQEKLGKIENPKLKEVEEKDELKDKWDDIGYTSEDYKGSWDYVGYKRRSRRIRKLDVYFETKDDRDKRERLEKEKAERLKRIKEEDEKRFKGYKLKFNINFTDPLYVVKINKKTGKLFMKKTGGFVSINYAKTTGTRRSCVQDAIINVGALFDIEISKEKIYEIVPPSKYENPMISDVISHPYVASRFFFSLVQFKFNKGGNEYLLFTELRDRGGKYIVLCRIISDRTKKEEKHVFVFDADYVNEEKKVKGAIIDNQVHTKLTGIEESDVKDIQSMRKVCHKLYGGKTFFTHCWMVFQKY